MTDTATALRALLDRFDHEPGPIIPGPSPTEDEDPPRSHAQPLASDGGGVKGLPEGTPPAPLTPSTTDATNPATTLAHGDLVRWRTPRAHGLGQLDRIEGRRAIVRPLLPARSHEIRVALQDLAPLCTLQDLARTLDAAR